MKLVDRLFRENRRRVAMGYRPMPMIVQAWWWLVLDVLRIEPYQMCKGHGTLRMYVTEPYEAWIHVWGRLGCRMGHHNVTCRGRDACLDAINGRKART